MIQRRYHHESWEYTPLIIRRGRRGGPLKLKDCPLKCLITGGYHQTYRNVIVINSPIERGKKSGKFTEEILACNHSELPSRAENSKEQPFPSGFNTKELHPIGVAS